MKFRSIWPLLLLSCVVTSVAAFEQLPQDVFDLIAMRLVHIKSVHATPFNLLLTNKETSSKTKYWLRKESNPSTLKKVFWKASIHSPYAMNAVLHNNFVTEDIVRDAIDLRQTPRASRKMLRGKFPNLFTTIKHGTRYPWHIIEALMKDGFLVQTIRVGDMIISCA